MRQRACAILGADSRNEADIYAKVLGKSPCVARGNAIGVLVIKIDQILRNLASLVLVAVQQLGTRKAANSKVEFP